MKIAVNGIRMNCKLEGPSKGSVVMLSHSLATDLTMWDAQIDALTSRHRLLRYDTRGHGGSDAPGGVYSLSQLAQDACGILDALGIERAHFIGLSMGGMIGQTLALEAPNRLLSLVLCDTTSRIPADARPAWEERIRIAGSEGMAPLVDPTIARWFTRGFRERRSDIVDRIRDLIRNTDPVGYIGCCIAIASLDVTSALERITVPTMVIVGEDDPGTPVTAATVIHENIPKSELAIIRSASHLSNVEQAEEFNRVVMEFLDRVEPHTEQYEGQP